MKICENGIIRDITAEEIAELERLAAEQPAPEPTAEERIAVLEEAYRCLADSHCPVAVEFLSQPRTGP